MSPVDGVPVGEGRPASEGVPAVDRRGLLLGVSALAVGTLGATVNEAAASGEAWRGEPFDDGTYFDDGYGWVD